MTTFLAGLLIFLGAHAFTMLRGRRAALVGRLGELGYKIGYGVVSLAGLWLLSAGFGDWRAAGMPQLWVPPVGLRHAASLLMLPAFVLVVAAYAPAGLIRTRAKHPMLAGIKLWALAHLLANGDLGTIILSGAILAWAVAARISLKTRPGVVLADVPRWGMGDWIALGLGIAAWWAFAFHLHRMLIGVAVFG